MGTGKQGKKGAMVVVELSSCSCQWAAPLHCGPNPTQREGLQTIKEPQLQSQPPHPPAPHRAAPPARTCARMCAYGQTCGRTPQSATAPRVLRCGRSVTAASAAAPPAPTAVHRRHLKQHSQIDYCLRHKPTLARSLACCSCRTMLPCLHAGKHSGQHIALPRTVPHDDMSAWHDRVWRRLTV